MMKFCEQKARLFSVSCFFPQKKVMQNLITSVAFHPTQQCAIPNWQSGDLETKSTWMFAQSDPCFNSVSLT